MSIEELNELLTAPDKEKVGTLYKVSVAYINMMLAGKRETKSKTAKRILRDLEILANINWLAEVAKKEQLQAA